MSTESLARNETCRRASVEGAAETSSLVWGIQVGCARLKSSTLNATCRCVCPATSDAVNVASSSGLSCTTWSGVTMMVWGGTEAA